MMTRTTTTTARDASSLVRMRTGIRATKRDNELMGRRGACRAPVPRPSGEPLLDDWPTISRPDLQTAQSLAAPFPARRYAPIGGPASLQQSDGNDERDVLGAKVSAIARLARGRPVRMP